VRGEDRAIGNAAFAGTAILEAAQFGRKPCQIGDFSFDCSQVIFRDAVDARTFPVCLQREPEEIPELVQRETKIPASP
jgi:hypothetical protein